MRCATCLCVVVALFALAMPMAARADSVGPPPTDCPVGAVGSNLNHATGCVPFRCTVDRDCARRSELDTHIPEGLVCRTTPTCQGHRRIRASGWSMDLYQDAEYSHGPCEVDRTCDDATCVSEAVCVPLAYDPARPHAPLPPQGGCGSCGGAGTSAALGVPTSLLTLAFVGVLTFRRSR